MFCFETCGSPNWLNHLTCFTHLKAVSKFKWCCGCPFFLTNFNGRRKKTISLWGLVYRGSYALIGIKDGVALAEEAGGFSRFDEMLWVGCHHCGCWRLYHGVCWVVGEFLCDPFVYSIRILQNHQQHLRCWPIMKRTPDFFCQSKKDDEYVIFKTTLACFPSQEQSQPPRMTLHLYPPLHFHCKMRGTCAL